MDIQNIVRHSHDVRHVHVAVLRCVAWQPRVVHHHCCRLNLFSQVELADVRLRQLHMAQIDGVVVLRHVVGHTDGQRGYLAVRAREGLVIL